MDQAALEAILQRLPLISEQQTRMLHAAWQGGDTAIRQRAWQHGKQALKAQQAEHLYEDANSAVSRWIRDYATGRIGMVANVADFSFMDQNRMEMRINAAPPILDAILGSLVADALPRDELEELLGPWLLAVDGSDLDDPHDSSAHGPTDGPDPDPRGDTHP